MAVQPTMLGRITLIVVVTAVSIASPIMAADAFKAFHSNKYGYSLQYPVGWYLDASLDNLEIENFTAVSGGTSCTTPEGRIRYYIASITICSPGRISENAGCVDRCRQPQ